MPIHCRAYSHLSAEERAVIMIERQNGSSLRAIARRLNRSVSTISREVRSLPQYDAKLAAGLYRQRRCRSRRRRRLVEDMPQYRYVYALLVHLRGSPEQIATKLRAMPDAIRLGLVSPETIYAAIYAQPRGALKQGLIQALRQAKPARGWRRTSAAGVACRFVPEALRIVHRPEDTEHRLLPGHWEGDFIKGAYNRSAVGVWVERKTRFVVLCNASPIPAQVMRLM